MHHFLNRRTKEERKQVRQLFLAVAGIVSLIFIFVFVGLPSYIKLSSFIANFKNETPQTNSSSAA
ncbi:MAG: hypothetical protein M1365_16710, partial [Actinobacteria bacterium]|nr:hypothetical protein [Actinomycetota bacterium]